MLQAELGGRQTYDPQFIEQQQALQAKYGPAQYASQLAALQQLDPYGTAARGQLGTQVMNDAKLGYSLDPSFETQLTSEIRGAEAARDPYGATNASPAGISAETLYKGRAAQQMYQQRLANLAAFTAQRSPVWDIGAISGVNPQDQFRLVDPNAGAKGQAIGQQNFGNALAAYQLSQGQNNALGGLIGTGVGAAAGGYFSGTPQGAQVGGALGGAAGNYAGGYFSDKRLKTKIVDTGKTTPKGIPIVEFEYRNHPGRRYRGVLAQDVLRVQPEAVFNDCGFLGVWYDMIGTQVREVT
jgi:hypothetical protein